MPSSRSTFPAASLLLALTVVWAPSAPAQQLPPQDVVDVPAVAEGLCVSNVFQSCMVLQRDRPIAVWGWAAPGERVTVTFGGASVSTEALPDRSWSVALAPQPASAAPRRLVVQGAARTLALDNVLVGDVWLLGGQSNMEFELEKVENGPLEVATANYPGIRVLTVPYGTGPQPVRSFARLQEWSDWFGQHFRKGYWDECTPSIARELSAIGYVFARRLHMASQVPIGIVDCSRGGTTVEAWTPLLRLQAMGDESVRTKLAQWSRRVAEWDAKKDLERRIREHREWVARRVAAGKAVPADRAREPDDLRPGPSADPNHPGHCHAGMLAPLAGLAIKGVIFHQGYNNALDGMPGVLLYRAVLPEMIRAWRETFADPRLPFGILSLCTEGDPQTRDDYVERMLDTGIFIRETHYRTFLDLRRAGDTNVGYASTFDLRRRWYHPQVKLPAGERIARWALATQYGFAGRLEWLPPALVGMALREGALELQFDAEVGDPQEGAITGFAIAGADGRFQPADAAYVELGREDGGDVRRDRHRLVLTSPLVPAPQHFRYAWGRNPLANLQAVDNKDLPVATQRSDDWALGEVPLGALAPESDGKGALTRAQWDRLRQALRQEDVRRRIAEAKAVLRAFGEPAEPAAAEPAGRGR